MKKKYFKLQLKSIFKILPAILLVTALTVVSIVTACAVLLNKKSTDQNAQKIVLGVVGDMEDTFLDIGLTALKNIDSSRFYVEIVEMSEDEAKKSLEARDISGYINIPDDYIESIYRGENFPAKYVTLNNPTSFGSIISDEIAELVSSIVTESQNGMYSMQDVARDYNSSDMNKKIEKLMLTYMQHIINRNDMLPVENLGVLDSLSFAGYYICGLLVLFMLLWGISCNRVFSSKNFGYFRLLKISGMEASDQLLCEYGAYLSVTVFILLLGAVLMGVVIGYSDFGVVELFGVSISDCAFFVVKILPVVIMITMLQMTVYECITNIIGAVLAQFLIAILLGYISGCFYPNYFFPQAIQNIALYLPVGAGFSFVRKVMSDEIPVKELCMVTGYSAIFAFVAIKMRNFKITGDIK